MPKRLLKYILIPLKYILIPWIVFLISAPYIADYINYETDIIWRIDKAATKVLVVTLLICLWSRDWALNLFLIVVSLTLIYQIMIILAVDFKPLLHLVGYNG